jgi:hypothetical protein
MSRWIIAVAVTVSCSAPAAAADLAKVDRSIGREPAYKSKAAKYCLLVFGPEARTRVWLALDGDTLYVGRNADGDLTAADARVEASKDRGAGAGDSLLFKAGDVRVGNLTHKNLIVSVDKLDALAEYEKDVKAYLAHNPGARRYEVYLEVERPGFKGVGFGGRVPHTAGFRDANGFLRFGDTPREAPVLHFGGPWQITLFEPRRLTAGLEADVFLALTTPGVGPGTDVHVGYEGVVPEGVHPRAEITYPPGAGGGPPAKEAFEFKERC